MDPLDEVRTVMAVFDETLFRVVPPCTAELDRGAGRDGAARGRRRRRPSCASAAGSAATGTATRSSPRQVTREAAAIQAEHVLLALENAATRIGRALTADAATTPPVAGAGAGGSPRRTPPTRN